MIYGSVCSGIEAATVAWHPLGWKPSFFSEIEKFPRAVLQHHYPDVPLHGDFTTIEPGQYEPIDLLVGGTPCQSFSVAGLRGGLADERGNLALEYLRLAQRLRPRWLVWENVPGVLSSSGGRDFGSILGGLVELGYGFAYRVLDAQFFGVPQRRRRVFVVGYLGDWRRAAAVLFERQSLSGHPAPRREAREATAHSLRARANASHRDDSDTYVVDTLSVGTNPTTGFVGEAVAHCLNAHAGRLDGESETFVTHALRAEGFDASEDGTGRGTPLIPTAYRTSGNCGAWDCGDGTDALTTATDPNSHVIAFSSKDHGGDAGELAPTLRAGGFTNSHANAGVMPAVAFNITPSQSNKHYNARQSERAQAVTGGGNRPSARGGDVIASPMAVRRLTPRECSRLQGFPDDYLDIEFNGNPAADGPRYKALGNSMAVPVMAWIGQRIQLVDSLTHQRDTFPPVAPLAGDRSAPPCGSVAGLSAAEGR